MRDIKQLKYTEGFAMLAVTLLIATLVVWGVGIYTYKSPKSKETTEPIQEQVPKKFPTTEQIKIPPAETKTEIPTATTPVSASKQNSSLKQNTSTNPAVSQPPTPTVSPSGNTAKKLNESNIYTIEDDGTIISSGVQSDRGIVDNLVSESAVINKFFKEYPAAPDFYNFVVILTNFKSPNSGHFTHARNLDSGISDFQAAYDIGHVQQLTGYSGKGKFSGYAYISDMNNSVDDSFFLILHELSHRWLFYLKGSGFIDAKLAHYDEVSTVTQETGVVYLDPNGGTSTVSDPSRPGYCLNLGVPNKYRFTSISLYLMGLIPTEQVIPLKNYQILDASDKGITCAEKTFSVQDVINIVGPRQLGQKDFSVAFVLLTHKGEKVIDSVTQRINYIANTFPTKWNEATNFKSTINGKGTIH